ncbi:glyoxalase superfamily protein [Cribrihabitans neustonicus]|uniref:glyoxalase superfamily protein n=1 Tax=Cribrihabitans neustonicus TaxID=1429085 RepID=UPI003B5CAFF6
MKSPSALPSLQQLKTEARLLRREAAKNGPPIPHATALERIAHYYGYRDWNTLRARASRTPGFQIGMRVEGRYLGQRFTGEILSLSALGCQGHRRITLKFDSPVDVVRFGSFSNLRQRVSATIDGSGRSPQKASGGIPHLLIDTLH